MCVLNLEFAKIIVSSSTIFAVNTVKRFYKGHKVRYH